MKTPSNEYELLHQFEVIFRDGEHKTQAASRDYSKVWENVIDNPPDELVDNEDCAMEITRLVAAMQRERECREKLVEALENASVVLYQHRTDGHGNPLCGWDFAVTMANINAALLAAKELK